jgi:hypothetical protein
MEETHSDISDSQYLVKRATKILIRDYGLSPENARNKSKIAYEILSGYGLDRIFYENVVNMVLSSEKP